jgi:hypothetical protein
MGGNRVVTRKVELVEARAARAALRRADYQRRKESGRCTREGCPREAGDSNLCDQCGQVVRAQNRQAVAARRERRRDAGRCRECGAKADGCRCVDCQIKLGVIAKSALARILADGHRVVTRQTLATTIEKDPRYPDGRTRTRYRGGQGRRGAPDRLRVLAADLDLTIASLRRAREKLDEACGLTDKRERKAKEAAAMGQVALAGRMIDEVMDRAGTEAKRP